MLSLPKAIADVLAPFHVLFAQQRSWQKAQEMLVGAILCQGRHTVSRVLQVMGLGQEQHYGNYYRMRSRVGWSGLAGAQTLLALFIVALVGSQTVVIGIDETLERRWGKRIWGLGIDRDGVKSSHKHVIKSSGVRWQGMQVLVHLPWSHMTLPRRCPLAIQVVLAPKGCVCLRCNSSLSVFALNRNPSRFCKGTAAPMPCGS
jgi:hypothetical protein